MSGKSTDKALREAFDEIDKNHSGTIDTSELQAAIVEIYKQFDVPVDNAKVKEYAEAFMKESDLNKDNVIQFSEFSNFFTQLGNEIAKQLLG
jgi:Ca2+-binding EF-hand superfamily protein